MHSTQQVDCLPHASRRSKVARNGRFGRLSENFGRSGLAVDQVYQHVTRSTQFQETQENCFRWRTGATDLPVPVSRSVTVVLLASRFYELLEYQRDQCDIGFLEF